jgi:hypothetical protein
MRESETYHMHMPSRRATQSRWNRESEKRTYLMQHTARERAAEGRNHGQGHDTFPQQRRYAARIENRNENEKKGRIEEKEQNKKSTHGPEKKRRVTKKENASVHADDRQLSVAAVNHVKPIFE